MDIDEDLVGWTDSFMRERRVRMVIDGVESEVSTRLPQDRRSPPSCSSSTSAEYTRPEGAAVQFGAYPLSTI